MLSTINLISDDTNLSFVCEENLGSDILIDKTAVKPSLISSPESDSLFFLLYSFEYLLIILVRALLNPNKCVPPSFWWILFVKANTSSEYPAFHSREHSTLTSFLLAEIYKGFLKTVFSFLFWRIGFLLLIYLTNSKIPPSYLFLYSFVFEEDLSKRVRLIPLLRNANSLILFWSVEELNFVEEKISFEGRKFITVPLFFDFPINLRGLTESPFLNSIKYFFPSLSIVSFNFSDKALTTETPTPCSPPETL